MAWLSVFLERDGHVETMVLIVGIRLPEINSNFRRIAELDVETEPTSPFLCSLVDSSGFFVQLALELLVAGVGSFELAAQSG